MLPSEDEGWWDDMDPFAESIFGEGTRRPPRPPTPPPMRNAPRPFEGCNGFDDDLRIFELGDDYSEIPSPSGSLDEDEDVLLFGVVDSELPSTLPQHQVHGRQPFPVPVSGGGVVVPPNIDDEDPLFNDEVDDPDDPDDALPDHSTLFQYLRMPLLPPPQPPPPPPPPPPPALLDDVYQSSVYYAHLNCYSPFVHFHRLVAYNLVCGPFHKENSTRKKKTTPFVFNPAIHSLGVPDVRLTMLRYEEGESEIFENIATLTATYQPCTVKMVLNPRVPENLTKALPLPFIGILSHLINPQSIPLLKDAARFVEDFMCMDQIGFRKFFAGGGLLWDRDVKFEFGTKRFSTGRRMDFVRVPSTLDGYLEEQLKDLCPPSPGGGRRGGSRGVRSSRRGERSGPRDTDIRAYLVDTREGCWVFPMKEVFEVLKSLGFTRRDMGGWRGIIRSLVLMIDVLVSALVRVGKWDAVRRLRAIQLCLLWDLRKNALPASLKYYQKYRGEYQRLLLKGV